MIQKAQTDFLWPYFYHIASYTYSRETDIHDKRKLDKIYDCVGILAQGYSSVLSEYFEKPQVLLRKQFFLKYHNPYRDIEFSYLDIVDPGHNCEDIVISQHIVQTLETR